MSKCSLTAMAMALPPCTFVEVGVRLPPASQARCFSASWVEIEVDFVEQGAGWMAWAGNSFPLVERCRVLRQ